MESPLAPGVVLNGRFKTLAPLNHGSFGFVYRALDLCTNRTVAVKCLAKNSSGSRFDDSADELRIHRRAGSHPNVVNLVCHYDTPAHLFLVLEYCPRGDLYEAIRLGRESPDAHRVRHVMLQLMDAISFLHEKGIYHRDIKPENIFLTDSGDIKLGDFGLATTDVRTFEATVGSDRYMAPEQYNPDHAGYSPAKVDVWALGVCLLNLLFARNPFATPDLSDPLFADFAADRQSLFDVFPSLSADAFAVLSHCLAIDPNNRSLDAARDALLRAESFTTDNESIDTPVVDAVQPVLPTVRLPLRTPSLAAPHAADHGAFPWSRDMRSAVDCGRQMEVEEDESLFSLYSRPDHASLASSAFDASVSAASSLDTAPTKPIDVQPSNASTDAQGLLSGTEFTSTSWWESFEDEIEERQAQITSKTLRLPARRLRPAASEPHLLNLHNQSSAADDNSTPVRVHDDRVSDQTGFLFEADLSPERTPRGLTESDSTIPESAAPTPTTAAPPSSSVTTPTTIRRVPSRSERTSPTSAAMDKWAALGDRRRAASKPSAATLSEWAARVERTARSAPRRGLDGVKWRNRAGEAGGVTVTPTPSPARPTLTLSTIEQERTLARSAGNVAAIATIREQRKRDREWPLNVEWRKPPASRIRSGLGLALGGAGVGLSHQSLRNVPQRLVRESPIPVMSAGTCGQVR